MAKVPDSNADSEGHGEENSDSDDPARKSEEVSGDKQIDAGCLQDQEDVWAKYLAVETGDQSIIRVDNRIKGSWKI